VKNVTLNGTYFINTRTTCGTELNNRECSAASRLRRLQPALMELRSDPVHGSS
jgi:hypothetical protein